MKHEYLSRVMNELSDYVIQFGQADPYSNTSYAFYHPFIKYSQLIIDAVLPQSVWIHGWHFGKQKHDSPKV